MPPCQSSKHVKKQRLSAVFCFLQSIPIGHAKWGAYFKFSKQKTKTQENQQSRIVPRFFMVYLTGVEPAAFRDGV